ncbi:hypothetical protein BH11MYX1_BH11MYX1_33760 [soil metagenome]
MPPNVHASILSRPDPGWPSMERWSIPLSLAVTIGFGAADYATGVDITFFVFMLVFPIGLGAWFHGRWFGAFLTLIASVFGLATFLQTHAFGVSTVANVVGTLGTLLLFVWTIGALHAYVQRERRERRIAIEQLRHAERLNIIGALAAGVAHELGTPLNVISGTAEMIEGDELPRANVRQLCGVIISQTERINAIVRHLLEFGRRGGASRAVVDLNQIASAAVELLAATARKSDVSLSLSTRATPIETHANGSELEQVVSNLILNGIQALPKGGAVRVSTSIEQERACITVEDEGVGIDAADLQRIFDPFFTTKGIGEGTGLGLSVSHGIVTDHEGTIDVRSTTGRGTTFAVMLPLAR